MQKIKELTTKDGSLTLYFGKFGSSITDNNSGITYAERNNSERPMFNHLYQAFAGMPFKSDR